MNTINSVSPRDREILRSLARRKMELAQDPVNQERREAWLRHDEGGEKSRPMVLIEIGGVQDKIRNCNSSIVLQCEGEWARSMESGFRYQFYVYDVIRDDNVIEPSLTINWDVKVSNYGVEPVQHRAENYDGFGARRWDPPIKDIDKDFSKLHPRTYSADREATLTRKKQLEDIFGGIIPVEIRGGFWWTAGLTNPLIDLIGLENLMLYMFDDPQGLHRMMAFLRDDQIAFAQWLEKENLLTLNNANDYIGSGSMGYSRRLPQAGRKPGDPVRLKDLWVLSESQETVGVGPDQFEEFIFPYQLSVAEKFGLCYYGCCEPVHNRWHILKKIPNLARVSVSPWADEEFMAREMGRKYVYSRKPNPSQISTGNFDETAIRADIRKTLTVARDCRVELIMKDVHTVNNEPERLARWVQLAREVIAETE